MSHKFLISLVLLALAGCQKPEDAKAPNAQTPAVEGQNAVDAKEAERPEPAQNGCEEIGLRPEDRAKWDCVPESGYWCTDPRGCPVNGNLAKVGTVIDSAESVPKDKGYELSSSCILCTALAWECVREEGCLCGSERIKKGALCEGGTYKAADALTGSCNKESCKTDVCHHGQCSCGKTPYEPYQDFTCVVNRYRANLEGMPEEDEDDFMFTSVSFHENRFDLRCDKEDGCPCGDEKCEKGYYCLVPTSTDVTSFCADLDEIGNREDEEPETEDPSDQEIPDVPSICDRDDGCPCGKQICPNNAICRDQLCIYRDQYTHEGNGETESHEAFYCDKAKGCKCGTENQLCPKDAFCHQTFLEGTAEFECFTVSKKFKNAKDLFKFNFKDVLSHSGDANPRKMIFDELYEDEEDAPYQRRYLEKKEGRSRFVVTSKPGSNCGDDPLKEGYLCVRQELVLGKEHSKDWSYKEYGHCRMPFEGSSWDSCRIPKYAIEQVCNLEKGCLCGSKKIPKGDVCVDGKGQCSSLDVRPGCLCGEQKIKSPYGCDEGQPICQAGIQNDEKSCLCRNQEIDAGDLCLKDRIICGENSTTRGCLCGEKTLREGYRCLQKEQICACNEDKDQPCECACGDQKIPKDAICRDDDTSLIPRYAQYLAEEDAYQVSCNGQEKKIKRPGYDIAKTEKDSVGEYSEEAFCTCGTGKPSPGKDYGCAYKPVKLGSYDAQTIVASFAGYQCQSFEGCACGDERCEPGDLCVIGSDDSLRCHEYNTFTGVCALHALPPSLIHKGGYACYAGNHNSVIGGWYCDRPEGCACGDAKCARWQLCMVPGICSKNQMLESQRSRLDEPKIIDLEEPD